MIILCDILRLNLFLNNYVKEYIKIDQIARDGKCEQK